jgi:hypothetical protein
MIENREIIIIALKKLGDFLGDMDNEEIKSIIDQAYILNQWFTPENVVHALTSIRRQIDDVDALGQWLKQYPISSDSKNVGLILAGNIPAVGWNDILCTLLSGHNSLIKYSEKDNVIIPFLIKKLISYEPLLESRFQTVERLKDFDAVIATGSNNTSKYFEQYFGHKPHIIRKNRNGIAILDGTETKEDFVNLGKDIFTYFGLGCRNVSKVYVPRGYDFHSLLETLHDHYKELANHNKYVNNVEYNIALYLLNKVSYQNNGCLIILEDSRFISRIASLHYEYYDNDEALIQHLEHHKDQIQCIVGNQRFTNIETFAFGMAQHPGLQNYADGVDTMDFLAKI